jgi:beta-glucosidase
LIGPNADSGEALLGDYSYTGGRRGFWWPRMVRPDALDEVKAKSVLLSIREQCPDKVELLHHPGCSLIGEDNDLELIKQAAAMAGRTDLAIIVAGERSTLLSGECRDRHEITLPGQQEELIRQVAATGTPVVLVLTAGRPLDLSQVEPFCSDILLAWYPGDEGGRAIADILFGKAAPGGRLPVSMPASLGLCPADSRMTLNTGWEKLVGGVRARPLYAFGHGLSYSEFSYSDLELLSVSEEERQVRLRFKVTNTGERTAEEVAQVYVGDLAASIVQPEFSLKAFRKLFLDGGEARTLELSLPFCALSFHNRKMQRVAEAGRFEIRIGRSYADIRLRTFFKVQQDHTFNSFFEEAATLT